MEPYLREGDFVFVNKCKNLKEGDIAVMRHPFTSRFLIKRIMKKRDGRYWFEGDNKNVSSDSRVFGWVGKNNILGRAKVIHK